MAGRPIPINAAALLGGRLVSAIVGVAIVSLSAHRLEVEVFGLVVSIMTAGFLANTVVTFGTDTVITRAVAGKRQDDAQLISASLKLQLTASAPLILGAVVAVVVGADSALLVQALALVPLTVVTVYGAVLRGVQRMDLLLWATLSGALVALVLTALLFEGATAAWVPITAIAAGSGVTAAVVFRSAKRFVTGSGTGKPATSIARETAPFAAMVILAAVGAQAGVLLVEFATDELTGGYGAAIRLSEAARLVPAAAMGAFFPAMLSGLHRTDQYQRWMRWLRIYAFAATAALLAMAGPINRIIFDGQPGGDALIRILALGLVFTVARLALSFELIATDRERQVLMSAILGAVITVVGGLLAAGTFGAQGVAWTQLGGLAAATLLLRSFRSLSSESQASSLV